MKTEEETKYKLEGSEPRKEVFWRVFRPVVDKKKCDKCGICGTVCPHGAISVSASGMKIDLARCDGCLICLRECPQGAISEVRE